MSLRTFAVTFVSVFFAELGDKTQLITLASSSTSNSKLSVFIGAASALVLASALGVLAGASIEAFVTVKTLERLSGCFFIAIGIFTLVRSFHS